jgi:signal transduction histidine kinase
MDKQMEDTLHQLAANTKIGEMSAADLGKFVARAIKEERDRVDRRIDHLQRQLNMLRSNDRARAARELHDRTIAEDADD